MGCVNRRGDHLGISESSMSTSKRCLDGLGLSINLTYPWPRTERRARMCLPARSTLSVNLLHEKNSHRPAKMVHSGGEPVNVGLFAKPCAKFACRWTQRRIARMSIVLLTTGESSVGLGTVMVSVRCACPGMIHRFGQEYVSSPGSLIPLREQG